MQTDRHQPTASTMITHSTMKVHRAYSRLYTITCGFCLRHVTITIQCDITTTGHSLSPFNGLSPDEPGLASVYWSKKWWKWWWQLDYWSLNCVKLQSNHHHQQINTQFFTGRMPFLPSNQQCQSTERKPVISFKLYFNSVCNMLNGKIKLKARKWKWLHFVSLLQHVCTHYITKVAILNTKDYSNVHKRLK